MKFSDDIQTIFENDDDDIIAEVFLAGDVLGIGFLRGDVWSNMEHNLELVEGFEYRVFAFVF